MPLVILALLAALAVGVAPAALARPTMTVVIDPGHGGKDEGAVGPAGTEEKDVALQIARRLQRLVNSQPGMRAALTRSGDQFLHLYERIAVARRHNADLFISIHADAVPNPNSRGASVFVLSTRGASSAAAHWLAKRENDADAAGVAWLEAKDASLRAVVFDIYHDAVLADSLALANQVLGQMRPLGPLHTGGVERAGFAVLKAPDTPSILVETGFISNAAEEAKLRRAAHQQQLAAAIMQGIRRYAGQRGTPAGLITATDGRKEITADRQPLKAAAPLNSRKLARPAAGIAVKGGKQVDRQIAAKSTAKPIDRPSFRLDSKPVIGTSGRQSVAGRPAPRTAPKAADKAARIHVVKTGESLAAIAQRYKVKLSALRSANGLTSQTPPRAGVALTIPAGDRDQPL